MMTKRIICKKCGKLINIADEDVYWDDSGYMYSAKLVNCNHCQCPNVLLYEEDSWLKEHSSTSNNYVEREEDENEY